jgi:multisubunit Na+/H+ antiporter MnhG subunit
VFLVVLVLVLAWPVLGVAIAIADKSSGALIHLVMLVVLGTLTVPVSGLAAAVLYFDLSDMERERSLG